MFFKWPIFQRHELLVEAPESLVANMSEKLARWVEIPKSLSAELTVKLAIGQEDGGSKVSSC